MSGASTLVMIKAVTLQQVGSRAGIASALLCGSVFAFQYTSNVLPLAIFKTDTLFVPFLRQFNTHCKDLALLY